MRYFQTPESGANKVKKALSLAEKHFKKPIAQGSLFELELRNVDHYRKRITFTSVPNC